jgi:hypothetical protein
VSGQALITEDDLKAWTEFQRSGDLERFLKENGIPYFHGRGGKLCTTLNLIESSKADRPIAGPEL